MLVKIINIASIFYIYCSVITQLCGRLIVYLCIFIYKNNGIRIFENKDVDPWGTLLKQNWHCFLHDFCSQLLTLFNSFNTLLLWFGQIQINIGSECLSPNVLWTGHHLFIFTQGISPLSGQMFKRLKKRHSTDKSKLFSYVVELDKVWWFGLVVINACSWSWLMIFITSVFEIPLKHACDLKKYPYHTQNRASHAENVHWPLERANQGNHLLFRRCVYLMLNMCQSTL